MLTSLGHGDGDVARCRRLGIDAYLTKPVKHSDLLDALATRVRRVDPAPRQCRARPPLAKRPRRALRILVAEDNPVNRKLVDHPAEKRGHKVTAVENGRRRGRGDRRAGRRFDVVLMDLQMPEMGGLEATQAIRAAEGATGRHAADRRADRARDAGRSRALPRCRHGRLSVEAD